MTVHLPRDDTPFVLLDDARVQGAATARLYTNPVQIIAAHEISEVRAALDTVRASRGRGLHAAGFLAYEAGRAFEPGKVAVSGAEPLLWFGLFEDYAEIEAEAVARLLPDVKGGWAGVPRPDIARPDYEASLAEVQALISAGDIYQTNLTFQADVAIAGHPLAIYAGLRARSRAGYGAVVHTGKEWLLSLSPELFFELRGRQLLTRPMKGTARRDDDPNRDDALAAALASDAKQRAENLMIVDLLRNDMARVAVAGSVAVPELFAVETYPTVHQMTSTVTATLAPGLDVVDMLAALFPCGSITGAPKIRAMEVIEDVEREPRGIYTGSIGRIDADGDAAFNVAIRTLRIAGGGASIGLGSGIVADSVAADEWRECLIKGAFVASPRSFDLIETMAFDALEGLRRLDLHLARLANSAQALGFAFDNHAVRNELHTATCRLRTASRVRLLLARSGAVSIETRGMPEAPSEPVAVALAELSVDPDDFRLRHKTTDRGFYDAARRQAGAFEVLFTSEGRLTEGSFTNVFVERGGMLLTPPLKLGLLPGVLRGELIAKGRGREVELASADLEGGFLIGNSLRGLLPARLAHL